MLPAKRMTAAEAAVLDAELPAGLTDDMKEIAFLLYEALVLRDARVGQAPPESAWAAVLESMARVVKIQLLHLAENKGGGTVYLAKCATAFFLGPRDLQMCAEFRGNNHEELARRYNLSEMRVRQIVGAWQDEQFRRRQGRLPGLDDIV